MQIFLSGFLNDANDANATIYKYGLLQWCPDFFFEIFNPCATGGCPLFSRRTIAIENRCLYMANQLVGRTKIFIG
jgi:hypothetical protein